MLNTEQEKIKFVKRKVLQRLVFTLVSLSLYFSFVLNWTSLGSGLRERIGESYITGSIAMFALLIVLFISLEVLFIYLARKQEK